MDLTGFTSLRATVDVHVVVLRELLCQRKREKRRPRTVAFADPSVLLSRSLHQRPWCRCANCVYGSLAAASVSRPPKNSSQQCLMLAS